MPPAGYRKFGEYCSITDCTRYAKMRGMCEMHYARWYRLGSTELTGPRVSPDALPICSVERCNKPVRSTNAIYCRLHYLRNYRYGRTENIIATRGEGTTTNSGYKLFRINNEQIYEHILLAEKALGRKLPKGAIVHHMNEKPADNYTPFNLIICPYQAYHMLLHQRMKEYKDRLRLEQLDKEITF